MEECIHNHLSRLEDPIDHTNLYQCLECKEILVLDVKPYVVVSVTHGTPPEKK
jgi:hypothetical protein